MVTKQFGGEVAGVVCEKGKEEVTCRRKTQVRATNASKQRDQERGAAGDRQGEMKVTASRSV